MNKINCFISPSGKIHRLTPLKLHSFAYDHLHELYRDTGRELPGFHNYVDCEHILFDLGWVKIVHKNELYIFPSEKGLLDKVKQSVCDLFIEAEKPLPKGMI